MLSDLEHAADVGSKFTDARMLAYKASQASGQHRAPVQLHMLVVQAALEDWSPEDLLRQVRAVVPPPPGLKPSPADEEQALTLAQAQLQLFRCQILPRLQLEAAEHGVDVMTFVGHSVRNPAAAGLDAAGIDLEGGFAEWLRLAAQRAPAHYLVAKLADAGERNRDRRPGYGDVADRIHVSLFPYVDLATADAHNCAVLRKALGEIRAPRCSVIRNPGRDITPIIQGLAALMASG